MTAYTDWDTVSQYEPAEHNGSVIRDGRPDLVAEFQWFNFMRPRVPNQLANADLVDAEAVSDQDLLEFLAPQ